MIWKVVAIIIDRHLTYTIRLHGVLHRFINFRVTGTSTLEAKVLQEIKGMYQIREGYPPGG